MGSQWELCENIDFAKGTGQGMKKKVSTHWCWQVGWGGNA
jgi:hypothetical protein